MTFQIKILSHFDTNHIKEQNDDYSKGLTLKLVQNIHLFFFFNLQSMTCDDSGQLSGST